MRYFKSLATLLVVLTIFSCKNEEPGYPEMSLLQYGMPVDIKAPEGATVKSTDLGLMKDVSVKAGDDYFVQIFSSEVTDTDPAAVYNRLIEEVRGGQFYSKIVEEMENEGFIFEKKIGDKTNYDFRHFKIIGDTEYIFQTGFLGTFTEDDVRKMYHSVK